MQYLQSKNVFIHEDKIVDQLMNLKNFLSKKKADKSDSKKFFSLILRSAV